MNASPAPIVSTISTAGAATSSTARVVTTSAPSPPSVTSATATSEESSARGVGRRAARVEPFEVLLARLDHVRAGEQAPEPAAVVGRIRDRGRAAVRVQRDERVVAHRGRERLERRRHRLEHEPQRADIEHADLLRQRGRGGGEREPGCRRAALVEAVARDAGRVELGERERSRRVRLDDVAEAHAVGLELVAQAPSEAVRRQAAEIGDRLLEPADRARDVVGAAAGVPVEAAVAREHEVDQRLAGDDDRAAHAAALDGAISPDPRATILVGRMTC
jgi:hypothetical protein